MNLLNVLEISPYDYSKEEYAFPNGSATELPAEWNRFWLKSISDSNLGHLTAVREGSYFVDIQTIGLVELVRIIKHELTNVEFDELFEQPTFLSDGIVIKVGEKIIIEPTCCGDLSNFKQWEAISDAEQNIWKELWIGHPWIYYRRNNGSVEISDYCESADNIEAKYALPENVLFAQLAVIKKEQSDFESKIRLVLHRIKAEGTSQQ